MSEPRSHQHILVQGGTLVTMDPARRVVRGDVLISSGRITAVGENFEIPPATRLINATNKFVLPGFIQAHVHLGQSLFKGLAEKLGLLDWLEQKIWPLEAAHTEESAYWAARLGAADCLLSGTTTVQEMGLVRGMEGVFRAIRDSGLRAVAGKCLMDSGSGVPSPLKEETGPALLEAEDLVLRWNGKARGRILGAVCPRFILSCSGELWEGSRALAGKMNVPIHTHLLESRDEEDAVIKKLGLGQMEYLDQMGILDTDLRIAHGVLLDQSHLKILDGRGLKVAHCPSANAKLGSGIANLGLLVAEESISVGIGCDGAACNNDLDVLEEMRLAGLLQTLKSGPAGAIDGRGIVEMATIEGARAIGLEAELGSIEPGKLGDLVVLDLDRPQSFGAQETAVYDRIVYGTARDGVACVIVDGEVLVENGSLPMQDQTELRIRPGEELESLLTRAELH